MHATLTQITLLVRDYDEALRFYTGKLGFRVLEDTDLGNGKRWLRVGPAGTGSTAGATLLLARAVGDRQRASIGNQTGGRVGFFLETDDFRRDHAALVARGVTFTGPPREEAYGIVAVFEDLYGNRFDLIERPRGNR